MSSVFQQRVDELEQLLTPAGNRPAIRAPRTLELEPLAFNQQWSGAPRSAVLLGLRVPPDEDVQSACAEAAKRALELQSDADEDARITAYNDALMGTLVARAICDPNDVTEPHPLLELPDEIVPLAFPPATIQYIYDAVERLQIETSPLYPEATDDEVADLLRRIAAGELKRLSRAEFKRALRYLRFVLDALRALNDE